MAKKRFYVYTLAEPNDLVFYVGKGQGKRVHAHEKEANTDCSCPKCERIRTIWAAGDEVKRAIVFETDDEADALQHERDLIAALGRANLCNRTDGGEWGRLFPNGFVPLRQLRKQLNAEAKKRLSNTPIYLYHSRRIELKEWVEREIERAAERARQHACLLENARAIARAERISIKRLLPPKPKSG